MLKPGDTAPDFTLSAPDGHAVTLSEELRQGPVVLAFYPADFTPVCTAQACMMRDAHARLTEAGYRVIAVSPQPAGSKARFAEQHNLPHTLLADPGRVAIKAFGVAAPLGLTRRATFLIHQNGTIADRVVADLRIARHRRLLDRLIPGDASRGS